MRDVAARAGVSVATVSRVLAGGYPVLAETRRRVERAARELGYVPNAHARSLAECGGDAGGGSIAVVVRTVAVPHHAYVAQAAQEEAARRGRLSLICTTGGDAAREVSILQMTREQGAEAVILVGGVVADEEYLARTRRQAYALAEAGSRLVLCGRPGLGEGVPAPVVDYDNAGGARAVTEHLLGAGHRRIAFLGAAPGHSTAEGRVAGYRRALAEHGLAPDPELEIPAGPGRSEGYRALRRRLEAGGPAFTAVVAGTDLAAAGALQALREHGLRVPEDVSVAGYDDVPPAAELGLTTVRLPYHELGRAAVRLALARADGEPRVTLPTRLVTRDSVRPPVPSSA
ncbi:LacI family DNA-binding transcriptional regulator [Thermocatellispora tengchongensis]